jgi:hypothetical protein
MHPIASFFMQMPQNSIPPDRRLIYYGGMALTSFGVLLFFSTFVTFLSNFGNFDDYEGRTQSQSIRAIGGMALIVIGRFMMNVGAKGWAGSGVVLDPEMARKDVEPWSRMGGGVVQDALSEVKIVKKIEDRLEAPVPQIKIRCKKCQSLNDEAAKFCNQCGAAT